MNIKDENINIEKNLIEIKNEEFFNAVGITKASYGRNIYNNKSAVHKMLSNEWTLLINWSINIGNHHFAVTINNFNIKK